jgi:hypothetical protein
MENTNNLSNDIINNFLEKISKITDEILKKIDKLEERITNIETKIENNKLVEKKEENLMCENLRELKKEDLNIDEKDVIQALKYKDYRSIIFIFKLYYKNKNNSKFVYPIRITGKRSYEFYFNNKWNPDVYGYNSMNILFLNIQNLFIKYNNIDNLSNEDFLLNQDFIYKLSNEKIKKDIFKSIIEEVRIN